MTNADHAHDDDLESEGIPALDDAANADEGIMSPRDYPVAVDEYGVTAAEQRTPESLEARIAREEPDVVVGDEDRVGRLVAPDAGGGPDEEPTEVARETEDDLGESAEEAAMHVTDG